MVRSCERGQGKSAGGKSGFLAPLHKLYANWEAVSAGLVKVEKRSCEDRIILLQMRAMDTKS
jgi:hypothetical protein